MKKEKIVGYRYEITKKDVDDFIADWLNEDNENFPLYVKGTKLFIEYLREKINESLA